MKKEDPKDKSIETTSKEPPTKQPPTKQPPDKQPLDKDPPTKELVSEPHLDKGDTTISYEAPPTTPLPGISDKTVYDLEAAKESMRQLKLLDAWKSDESIKNKVMILKPSLPLTLAAQLKGKERVSGRTVEDMMRARPGVGVDIIEASSLDLDKIYITRGFFYHDELDGDKVTDMWMTFIEKHKKDAFKNGIIDISQGNIFTKRIRAVLPSPVAPVTSGDKEYSSGGLKASIKVSKVEEV